MDCHKTLVALGLCLLMGTAGCSHNVATGPSLPPALANNAASTLAWSPVPAAAVRRPVAARPADHTATEIVQVLPPGAVLRQEADLPPRTPHASTCTAFGDWAASEANAPDMSDSARQTKREQARKAYRQALSIDPHYLPAYESLASLYGDLKDHAHAVATYRLAAKTFPNEGRVFYEWGKCHGAVKEWEPAIQALARAVQLDPENRQYVDTLGWMQARVGLYDDSLATFRKVHDLGEAHYRLALMLEHLNQIELCKQHLQAALASDPRQSRAKALLAQLSETPAPPAVGVGQASGGSAIQLAAYTESAKPRLTGVAPAPEESPALPANPPPVSREGAASAPRGRAIILPPPPRISIQYEGEADATPHEAD